MTQVAVQPKYLNSGPFVGAWFVLGMRLDRQRSNQDLAASSQSSLKCRIGATQSGINADPLAELDESNLAASPLWDPDGNYAEVLFLVPASVTEGLDNEQQTLLVEFEITPPGGWKQITSGSFTLHPRFADTGEAPPGTGGGIIQPEEIDAADLAATDWWWVYDVSAGESRSLTHAEFQSLITANPNAALRLRTNFSYGDASPVSIHSAAAGETIYGVRVGINTAFNNAGASISVGTDADPEMLVPADLIDVYAAESYVYPASQRFDSATEIKLFINPGSATQGGGFVLVEV